METTEAPVTLTTRTKRVFFAAPFTQLIDPDSGSVGAHWRSQLLAVRDGIRARGNSVFLAHQREAWGDRLMTPDVCTPLDYQEMVDADVVCAVIGSPPSHGVHIELGWASAMRKPILLVLQPGVAYTPLLHGIAELTRVWTYDLGERLLADAAQDICGQLDEIIATL
jgi:hypothetical protein